MAEGSGLQAWLELKREQLRACLVLTQEGCGRLNSMKQDLLGCEFWDKREPVFYSSLPSSSPVMCALNIDHSSC